MRKRCKLIRQGSFLTSAKSQAGFGMIEVLFATAFLALAVGVLMTAYITHFRLATAGSAVTAAVFLADEGLEAVRSMRDGGWSDRIESLDTEVEYHLIFSNGEWSETETPQIIDGTFTRTFTLYEVRRDQDDNIAESGQIDERTLLVVVEVRWSGLLGESERSLSTYIADLRPGS